MTLLIKEGQRVPAGTTVVEIKDESREQEIGPRLSEARENIRRFDLEAMEALHQLDEAITDLDNKLVHAKRQAKGLAAGKEQLLRRERSKGGQVPAAAADSCPRWKSI